MLSVRPEIHWYCHECQQPAIQAVLNDHDIEERCNEYMTKITERLNQVESKLDCKADRLELQKLETRLQTMEARHSQQTPSPEISAIELRSAVTEEINEQLEQTRRAKNLIMYNMPETTVTETSRNAASLPNSKDEEAVSKLLTEGLNLSVHVEKCNRIGEKKGDKPRLLKIVMATAAQKGLVLRHAIKVKKIAKFGERRVIIKPDLTPKQRELDKALREDLRKKNAELQACGITTERWKIQKGELRKVQI